jgi:hypothetical protein
MLGMASSRTNNWGTAIGQVLFSDHGLPLYRGWSMRHGMQRLATDTTLTPAFGTKDSEDDMYGEKERNELIGERIDGRVIPLLQHIAAALGMTAQQIADLGSEVGNDESNLKTAIRREGRARLYRNAATRELVAAKIADGFWYPLNPTPRRSTVSFIISETRITR